MFAGLESAREGKAVAGPGRQAVAGLARAALPSGQIAEDVGLDGGVRCCVGTEVVIRDVDPESAMASSVDLAAEAVRGGGEVGVGVMGDTLGALSFDGRERGPLNRLVFLEWTDSELERVLSCERGPELEDEVRPRWC